MIEEKTPAENCGSSLGSVMADVNVRGRYLIDCPPGADWQPIRDMTAEIKAFFLPWINGSEYGRIYDPVAFSDLCDVVDGVRKRSTELDQESRRLCQQV